MKKLTISFYNCTMPDFRDFISYELPEWAHKMGVNSDRATLKGDNREKVEKALEEIATTPEAPVLVSGPQGYLVNLVSVGNGRK